MSLYGAPICVGCKHFRGYQWFTDEELRDHPEYRTMRLTGKCDAYPDDAPGHTNPIPQAIWVSAKDHRKAVSGDQGIRYEAKTADDAKYAELLFDR